MYNIYIDESGIHKNIDHSSFVLAYIEFENYTNIESKIQKIEKELKIEYFHWSETTWKVKEKFIDKVLELKFKVKIAIVKNPVHPEKELEKVLAHTLIEKDIKNIFIDGKKPKWYERKIKLTLRNKNISTKKLKTVRAKQSAGVRIADMVAGLARSYYDKKNMGKIEKYYKKLEKKIIITLK